MPRISDEQYEAINGREERIVSLTELLQEAAGMIDQRDDASEAERDLLARIEKAI